MTRSSLPIGLSTLKKWWESEEKILKCTLPFQRHGGMWNSITKSNLVWSLLADSYVPPIVLLKDKAGVDSKGKDIYKYQIEDGQQRLTTLFAFMNDEYELHGATPEVEVEGTVYDLAGYKYSELSEECQDAIKNYRFSVQCLENYTMEEAEALFFNINSGVALSKLQVSKSKMGSDLITFFNELLSRRFFTQAINITEKQAKAEDDLLMLLQGCLLLDNRHEGRAYKNIAAATCLSYAESIKGTFDNGKRQMVAEVVDFLNQAFEGKCKFMRKNNTPIIFVCAKIALEQGIEPQNFKSFIDAFANNVYPAYEEASNSGNIKAPKVQMRLRVMFLAMCDFFKLNPDEVLKPFSEEIPLYVESNNSNTGVVTDQSEAILAEEAEAKASVEGDDEALEKADGVENPELIVGDVSSDVVAETIEEISTDEAENDNE